MFRYKFLGIFLFVFSLWFLKIIETTGLISFVTLGIYPRQIEGLIGIFFSPLIHGDFFHLLANTIPIIILGAVIVTMFSENKKTIFITLYLIPGIFVWFFGRESYHIGASGMIYGLASFIFFSGIFDRNKKSPVLSLIIIFLYGGLIWGVLPLQEGVSYESHLSGAICGLCLAVILKSRTKILLPSKKGNTSTTFDGIDFKYTLKEKEH